MARVSGSAKAFCRRMAINQAFFLPIRSGPPCAGLRRRPGLGKPRVFPDHSVMSLGVPSCQIKHLGMKLRREGVPRARLRTVGGHPVVALNPLP